MFLCCVATTFAQYSGSGNGTEDDPYLIYNENQLSQVSNFLNQEGVVFKLMKDLNLANWIAENNPSQGWLPIGVESTPFKGKFYGNNHKISGLKINRTSTNNVGFFGYVANATIRNLTIEGTTVSGSDNVGVLFGYISGSTVTNCHVLMTGSAGVSGKTFVGGFAGYSSNTNYSTFSVNASVTSSAGLVGGFIGKVEGGGFINGSASGAVSVTGGGYAGGLFGKATGFTLNTMIVNSDVTGRDYSGGISGYSTTGSLTNCTYEGSISGNRYVGGIVGSLETTTSSFESCFSKGKITATGDYCGGIVGVSQGACIEEMESCSHFGDISGQSYVGGLVGAVLNTVEAPTLHTYETRYSSGSHCNWYYETISTGSSVTKMLNNCTAIGNIAGSTFVGGLIGSEITANGYSSSSHQTEDWYVYEGTTYIKYGKQTYYTYTRNTISLSLTNNYFSGTLQGTENVGGLVGYKSGGVVQNNYAYANIFGTSKVGGIVGQISADIISNSYNTTTLKSNVAINGTVSATASAVGRIYGSTDNMDYTVIGALASAEGNRALTQTKVILQGVVQEVGDDLQNGTSIGPSLLRLKATYVSMGWNFDDNWNSLETECYPYKKYQAAPPIIKSDLVSQATSISGQSLNGGTVYLYYKDRDAVSTVCDGYNWTFDTEALQSGAPVQIYADVEGMTPSYFTSATVGYPGSGTEDDPYRIYTAEDLQGASNRGYYKLMNDIDLTQWINENSPTEGWPAIGRNSGEATYIDGDGHKVTGLWMNTTQNYNGLFSNFSAGQIKNLTVEVATGKKVKGGDYTGILIGRNANGRLVNCSVKGAVEGTGHVGGVVGYVENTTISAITADADITGTSYVGGVAGQTMNCTMTTCNAVTTIVSSGANSNVGGLVGYAKGGSISKCSAQNNLTAANESNSVGGLVGYSETPVSLSFSTGSVAATGSDSYSGGLVGYALSPIENSYSTANAGGTQFTAGLVGYTFSSIDKCYAKGDVNGVMYGGGVVGELDGSAASISNSIACCNTLSLTAQSSWGSRVIGGFKNGAAEPGNTNFALSTMQVSLNNVPQTKTDDSVEGIAKTGAELMLANTYLGIGWDFSEVWGIDEGQMYPYLLWEIDIKPVADVSFDKTTLLLAVDKSETINASVLPLGATNKRLEWTSSNTAVATVADGVVTAVAVGTATITATSTDGSNISATCAVTVTANHDAAIAALQTIVDRAQSLYDNSTEGENIGQYAAGARAQLLSAINSVNGRITSTMSDDVIVQCTNEINAAIELFQSKKVTAGDDTDISQIANTIYIERIEASSGSQIQLSVKMKNTVAVQGYQFDLYLPKGVTVANDEDGFAMAELSTDRTTVNKTNYFDTAPTSDGGFRVLCGSSKGYTFSDNDGEVAIITLNISQDMEEGEHAIVLKNIKLSDNSGTPYSTEYLKSTIVISSYTLGDVNNDGSIDVADFIAVANHILGKGVNGFVAKAADANEDGFIDVADFIAIANMILHQQVAGSRQMRAELRASRKSPTDLSTLENAIYVEPITASPGTQQVLSVRMKNVSEVAGFEFDLQLPEGVTVATDEDYMNMAELSTNRTTAKRTNYFDTSLQNDGTLKVLCGTSVENPNTGKLYTFSGNDGEVALITVNVAADMVEGVYPVIVKNAILSDPNAQKTNIPTPVGTSISVGENVIALDENSTTAPTNATDVKVRVKRTINAGEWSTICLPFAMSQAQCQAAFGNDVQIGDFTGCTVVDDNVTVNFSDVTTMESNHPYIIKVSSAVNEFTVNGVDIAVDDAEVKVNKSGRKYNRFIGNYENGTELEDGFLFLNANKFYFSNGSTKIKAFRGYFNLETADAYYESRRVVLNFGDATGIETLVKDETDEVFNLSGQRVKTPTKGLYIKNGKKVVVK